MAAPRCCATTTLLLALVVFLAAATEFAQVPPVTFPGRVPVNRQLSLQQQTQILKDVQQHHRFTPLELPTSKGPLLYSQQSIFPGGSPQQQQQHHHVAAANPPTFHNHHHQQQQHHVPFSPAAVAVTPSTVTAAHSTFQYDVSQFGLKSNVAAFQPQSLVRPRARLVEPQQQQQQQTNEALPSVPVYLQDDRQKLYQQIKEYRPSPTPPEFRPTPTTSSQFFFRPTAASSLPPRFVPTPTTNVADHDGQRRLQDQLQKQFTSQLQHRQELIRKLKLALVNAEINDRQTAAPTTTTTTTTTTTVKPRPTEIYLSDVDGKLQVFNSEDDVINLQAVRSAQAAAVAAAAGTTPATPVVVTTTTSTTPAPTVSFEELSKGVLPPGAQFEVIRHKQDGELEEVGKLPVNLPQKKVTFVFLEEQPDGTLKVQGVKANADQTEQNKESSPEDIESILKKLQEGEIKLPPSNKLSSSAAPTPPPPSSTLPSNHRFISRSSSVDSIPPTSSQQQQQAVVDSNLVVLQQPTATVQVRPEIPPTFFPSTSATSAAPSGTPYVVHYQQPAQELTNSESVLVSAASQAGAPFNEFVDFSGKSKASVKVAHHAHATLPTPLPPTSSTTALTSTTTTYRPPRYRSSTTTTTTTTTTERSLPQTEHQKVLFHSRQSLANHSNFRKNVSPSPPLVAETVVRAGPPQQLVANDTLMQVLKATGLFAMARFLKESSLDNVLNETGPYTIFVPTDKAFRALLVQLGGPEKAEEKFRENPRLLSGLLLHHVVPGGFKLGSLQDEMTGVSLAGTQLRVNTYTAQDNEWNDLKVVTINGARVVPGLQDLVVPQGVMHAVDRVMFPLPVGDLLQTLLADRDARFDSFLRAVRTSGLAPVLAGSKTHTLLAPTERAFSQLSPEERTRILTERDAARALVTRHVVRGALYTAGLRLFQVKDSLAPEHQLTLTLDSKGHLKVNSVPVVTQNIPATNGVVHALDNLL